MAKYLPPLVQLWNLSRHGRRPFASEELAPPEHPTDHHGTVRSGDATGFEDLSRADEAMDEGLDKRNQPASLPWLHAQFTQTKYYNLFGKQLGIFYSPVSHSDFAADQHPSLLVAEPPLPKMQSANYTLTLQRAASLSSEGSDQAGKIPVKQNMNLHR